MASFGLVTWKLAPGACNEGSASEAFSAGLEPVLMSFMAFCLFVTCHDPIADD